MFSFTSPTASVRECVASAEGSKMRGIRCDTETPGSISSDPSSR